MKHDTILSNDIRNQLQCDRLHIRFQRYHTTNARIGNAVVVIIGNTEYTVTPILSYDTIVAYYDVDSDKFYEIGKYSQTTSKQVTMIYNEFYPYSERIYCDRLH